MHKYFFIGLCLLLTIACQSQEGELLKRFEDIKELGNSDPQLALVRLDSLSFNRDDLSTYALSKYELLKVRLSDKADIMPSSDKVVKELVTFFDAHGTEVERQEAHYYAGSVYRDLQDTPRALEHFLKSMYIAEKSDARDSLLLRNTFSNLCYLFDGVCDNTNCLLYAKRECELSADLGILNAICIQHLADAYMSTDSIKQALDNMDLLLQLQKKDPNREILFLMLHDYSFLKKLDKASECKLLVDSIAGTELSAMTAQEINRLGSFYWLTNNLDKAKECYDSVLIMDGPLVEQYDAARKLIVICNWIGEKEQACRYATRFVQLCDTLNMGHNQQMAATVNNIYKYQRDKDEEQRVYDESQRNQRLAIGSVACIILLVIIGILVHVIHKNKHLQKVLMLTGELSSIKDAQKKLLIKVEQLKQQNENYDRLLHQVKLQSKSSDIFNSLQQATIGLHKMNPDEWQQFYQVVDQQYPDFKKKMLAHLGSFSEKQMQFCYLLRMGFNKPEIENITDLTHVTVWRWEKKFDWIRKESESDIFIPS